MALCRAILLYAVCRHWSQEQKHGMILYNVTSYTQSIALKTAELTIFLQDETMASPKDFAMPLGGWLLRQAWRLLLRVLLSVHGL